MRICSHHFQAGLVTHMYNIIQVLHPSNLSPAHISTTTQTTYFISMGVVAFSVPRFSMLFSSYLSLWCSEEVTQTLLAYHWQLFGQHTIDVFEQGLVKQHKGDQGQRETLRLFGVLIHMIHSTGVSGMGRPSATEFRQSHVCVWTYIVHVMRGR